MLPEEDKQMLWFTSKLQLISRLSNKRLPRLTPSQLMLIPTSPSDLTEKKVTRVNNNNNNNNNNNKRPKSLRSTTKRSKRPSRTSTSLPTVKSSKIESPLKKKPRSLPTKSPAKRLSTHSSAPSMMVDSMLSGRGCLYQTFCLTAASSPKTNSSTCMPVHPFVCSNGS